MARKEAKKVRGIYEKAPGSGVWWIRYSDATGRIRREKAGLKQTAETLYRKRKTEVLQGKKLPEARKRVVSFGELIDDSLVYSKAHKRSYQDDKWRFEKLRKHFGDRPADGIMPQDIERHLAAKIEDDKWAPATANRCRALLSLAFRLGIRNGKVSANPARLVRAYRVNNTRVRWLTTEEEMRLREVLQEKYPEHLPELDLALHTGLRRGEMYKARWEDVNFEQRLLKVPLSKNGESRHVPLNRLALAALERLRSKCEGKDWIFVSVTGERLQSPRHWFEPAIQEAKIADFHWHDARHTFASRLRMAGVDLGTIQELMGHKSISMTCRYAHLAPTYQLAAVERLAEVGKAVKSEAPTDTRTSTGVLGEQVAQPAYVN